MKTLGKAIAVASLAAVSVNASAVEGLSATVGAVSDYIFYGKSAGDAGAYASIDYEIAGFYAGVWAIDSGDGRDGDGDPDNDGNDGLEVDLYVGYGIDLDGLELGIGYTRYEYTGAGAGFFEDEFSLSAGFAGVGLDVRLGNADDGGSDDTDYTVIQLSYGSGPYGINLGFYDRDQSDADKASPGNGFSELEYTFAEVSYSAEVGTFDVTTTIGGTFDEKDGGTDQTSTGSEYIVFDISKSFDI